MARCGSCGAVVKNEAEFCPRCLTPMSAAGAPAASSTQAQAAEPPVAPEAPVAPATQYAPYPSGPPQYGAPAPTDGSATGALVCSILSFVVCPIVLSVIGLVLASNAKKRIRASGGAIGGEGIANAATIISIINIALAVVFFVLIVAVAVLGTSSSSKFSIVGSSVNGFIIPI